MARCVLDTNVVLDLVVFDDPGTARLAAALDSGAVRLVRSAATEAEWREVMLREGITRRAAPETMAIRLARFEQRWLPGAESHDAAPPSPWLCRDPDDQKFLDLAHAARAALLTKDRALLALARKAAAVGLWIGPPAAWSFD